MNCKHYHKCKGCPYINRKKDELGNCKIFVKESKKNGKIHAK